MSLYIVKYKERAGLDRIVNGYGGRIKRLMKNMPMAVVEIADVKAWEMAKDDRLVYVRPDRLVQMVR